MKKYKKQWLRLYSTICPISGSDIFDALHMISCGLITFLVEMYVSEMSEFL
jgi:hypothetical protein